MTAPPQPPPPAFIPRRTLPTATTWAELTHALASLEPGDSVTAHGINGPPEAVFARTGLTGPAQIILDGTCKFQGGGALRTPAIWFARLTNLRVIFQPGCVVTNPKQGAGIEWAAAVGCVFDGFDVRNAAGSATGALPILGNVEGNYFRGTVRDWALVPSLDNHVEKGTGLHGMLMADAAKPYYCRDNTVVLTTPGSALGGSLLEVGQPPSNAAYAPVGNRCWLQAANLLQDAKVQTAGNGLNLWGVINGVEILWVGAIGLHGHAVNDAGLDSTAKGMIVRTGSAVRCCLNPRYAGQSPWQKHAGVTYSPGPFVPSP